MVSVSLAAAATSPAAVLARNQLSSLLAQAFPEDLATSVDAQRRFLAQQPSVCAALERHNVLGRVRDGKALAKLHARVLQLLDSPVLQTTGWQLARVAARQSGLEALEALAPALLSRAVRLAKSLASTKQQHPSDEDASALAAACQVCALLLGATDRFAADVRRDLLDLLAKQLVPALLSFLLAAMERPEASAEVDSACVKVLGLLTAALDAAPSAMRSHATKTESASVAALFRRDASLQSFTTDADQSSSSHISRAAVACLSKLPAASDKPLETWTQMALKAIEALHAQLDLLAGKRSVSSSTPAPTNLKIWMRHSSAAAIDADLSALERGDASAVLFSRAADALAIIMTSRIVSEREVQAVLPDVIAVARRALATRAHEVGKHTGVSEDGARLPVSVVYGVLPVVHASALQVLSSAVGRAGLCSLRFAGRVTRTLLLAVENLRLEAGTSYTAGGSTLGSGASRALYSAVAVCVSAMGASTVERLGSPLLSELVVQCQTQLEDPPVVINTQAAGINSAGGDGKGKKRKRQQASGMPDVSQLNAALATDVYVSAYERQERAANAHAALAAVATCVAVYGSLLPEVERRAASDVALLAATKSSAVDVDSSAGDAVALAMLTDAVTCDAASAHGGSVLSGLESWQQLATRRNRSVAGGSSDGVALSLLLPLAALSAGEALLHPRAPPFVVNVATREEEAGVLQLQKRLEGSVVVQSSRRGTQATPVRGDADDWHVADVAEENDGEQQVKDAGTQVAAVVEEEEEEEEDYEDERPVKKTSVTVESGDDQRAASDEGEEEAEEETKAASESEVKAKVEEDEEEEDDEFPDIVMDDEDDE